MLFDVGKGADDRSDSKPNTHDTLIPGAHKAKGTTSENHVGGLLASAVNANNENTAGPSALRSGFGRLIQANTVEVINDGSSQTVTSIAHNLGFTPVMVSTLADAAVTNVPEAVSIFLPTFLTLSTVGGYVQFSSYILGFPSANNVYFQLINGTGNPISVLVTYYLYQQRADRLQE